MTTASVEEFQKYAAKFLTAAEHGEPVIIARDRKPIARLLPMEENDSAETEHEAWGHAGLQNLARAYGPDEPDYSAAMIIELNPHYRP